MQFEDRFAVADPVDNNDLGFFSGIAAALFRVHCAHTAACALHHRQALKVGKACLYPLVVHGLMHKKQQPIAGNHHFAVGSRQVIP